jgi:alkanesulfonate monooxygenase SsuD/methylene tetrahydromethanopterin reductase-like flavin-dependent oxidoreductase (luciferase family)
VLGIGAGWNRTEFDAFGIPYDERAARFEEAFEIVRRLLGGEPVTFEGRFHRTEGAVLLPRPPRRTRLMVGSTGERVLRATLPHVDAWNTWWDAFDNRPEDFTKVNARISELAREVGRAPEEVERSACALVVLDRSAGERHIPDGVAPLEGSTERIAAGVRELADAGADEVILVLSPNTERSIRDLAGVAG